MNILRRFFRRKPQIFIKSLHQKDVGYLSSRKQKFSWKKRIFFGVFGLGTFIGLLGIGYIWYTAKNTPNFQPFSNSNFAESSVIYDRTGEKTLYTIHGEENRKNIPLEDISPWMVKAIISAEDANFYKHNGVDIMGILRSAYYLLRYQEARGGGSTITQQLIKNVVFTGNEKTIREKIDRKIQEIVLAKQIEKEYSKDQILELYLNRVPFGRNAYGVERAAQIYFDTTAKDLNIAQSAFLASLPQAPGRFSRRTQVELNVSTTEIELLKVSTFEELNKFFPDQIIAGVIGLETTLYNEHTVYLPGRMDYVLAQMEEKGMITNQEHLLGKEQSKSLEIKAKRTDMIAPHFVEYVRDILEEKYDSEFIERGGLKIITTLDSNYQDIAEEEVKIQGKINAEQYQSRNSALLSINPQTGEILAMVGSRDYFADELEGMEFDGKVNVITSRRQTGSTFKPIAYAAAFEQKGLGPESILLDIETDFGTDSDPYIPANFDLSYHGPVTIRKSLGNSYNIPAIKAGIIAGLENTYNLATKMGISFEKDYQFYGAALPLGVAEITPLDLSLAYSTFANGGRKIDPIAILKIIDANGEILFDATPNMGAQFEDIERQVISPETAYLITNILSDNNARGDGWGYNLDLTKRPNGAKTGTTNDIDEDGNKFPHDGWTIGYTPQILTVVWTGNNKGWEENPKGLLAINASGLKNAAPIWKNSMKRMHEGMEVQSFEKPSGITSLSVSRFSGLPPSSENFPENYLTEGLFNKNFLPEKTDNVVQLIEIESKTGNLPNEFTPPDAIKKMASLQFHSYFPDREKWEAGVSLWFEKFYAEFLDDLQSEEQNLDGIIFHIPEEKTNIYTQETFNNSPTINIISPVEGSTIAPPKMTVEVGIEAPNEFQKLEFFIDDELVETKKNSPYIATLNIPSNKSNFTLRVDAIDKLLYRSSDQITLAIGTDTTPPSIEILSPLPQQNIPQNIGISFSTLALDTNGAILEVSFKIDGETISQDTSPPYLFLPNISALEIGEHTLTVTATDTSGNSRTEQRIFSITTPISESTSKPLQIDSPTSNSTITEKTTIIKFFVPEEMRTPDVSIDLIVKQSGRKTLASISGDQVPSSGEISIPWHENNSGEYELSLKASTSPPYFSKKVTVIKE